MFGLLVRPATARGSARKQVVLRLEGFEGRDQPSAPAFGTMAVPVAPPTNQAPQIVNFSCQQIGSGLFLITGRVVDENPGGLPVTLGGTTSAAGQTATTQADGTFSLTVQLRVDGTDCGWITATTVDAQGLRSNEVEQWVDPTP
jgi:hypothetical protein